MELCLIFLLGFLGCSKDDDTIVQEIAVQEREISTDDLNMNIGTTVQLSTTVIPEDADDPTVLWGSENPDIA